MFAQNFTKLSATVYELQCLQINNTVFAFAGSNNPVCFREAPTCIAPMVFCMHRYVHIYLCHRPLDLCSRLAAGLLARWLCQIWLSANVVRAAKRVNNWSCTAQRDIIASSIIIDQPSFHQHAPMCLQRTWSMLWDVFARVAIALEIRTLCTVEPQRTVRRMANDNSQ